MCSEISNYYNDFEEDGLAACSIQGSLRTSAPSRYSVSRRNLPTLPVSPIKSTDVKSLSRRSSCTRKLLLEIQQRKLENVESFGQPTANFEEEYSRFRHKLFDMYDSTIDSNKDSYEHEVIGKELYDQLLDIRHQLVKSIKPQKEKRSSCSTFRQPQPSFCIRSNDEISGIEMPRNNPIISGSSSSQPIVEIVDRLADRTLEVLNDGQSEIEEKSNYRNKNKAQYKNVSVMTSAMRPSKPTDLKKYIPVRKISTTLDSTPVDNCPDDVALSCRSISLMNLNANDDNVQHNCKQTRTNVRHLLRGLLCDVDTIPHKGNFRSNRIQQNSKNIQRLLGGSRSQSRPKIPISVPSTQKPLVPKKSPTKLPPFCSSVNNENYSQAIFANEQQLIKIVNTNFPHWRKFVKKMLIDSNIGNNVAVRFMEEIEARRRSKEDQMLCQAQEDHQVIEFNSVDEKIAVKLRQYLCRGHPSRMQQLRILQQVLRDSC